METNFFRIIAEMGIRGDLHLIIRQGENKSLVVSTMVQNDRCTDRAKELIAPFNLRGTAEQMDKGYFKKMGEPIREASELMDNMQSFKKQVEEAKSKSAMARETGDREKKTADAREKKYQEGMQKADALEKEGKFREAWMKVPDPSEYPEKAEELRNRREQLSARFAPDLFATTVPKAEPTPQDSNLFPETYTDNGGETEIGEEEENNFQY